MSGWGGLGGYVEDLANRRERAGDVNDSSPSANVTRRACDWAARKGGVVAGAPQVQFACGPYWNSQPDYVPPEPTSEEVPFEGGQCADAPYRATFRNGEGGSIIVSLGAFGPISQVFQGQVIDSFPGFEVRRYGIAGLDQNGDELINVSDRTEQAVNPPLFFDGLTRDDFQPDNCGNPEPTVVNPDPRDVPFTRLPPDGTPVPIGDPNDPDDTTPPIIFPPTDTPYDPWIPIINPPPGFPPFVLPPSSGDDIPPREGPETDVPPGGTDGDDIPAPEPVIPSEVCIGYAFDFYDIPANRGGISGSAPARYYEIFGSAQLKISTDSGEFYDLPVKIDSRRGVCYRSDESLKVIGLSLNSKVSFGPVRVKPIFVLREDKS